jgi:hypothetical protein
VGLKSPDEVRQALFLHLSDEEIEKQSTERLEQLRLSLADEVVQLDLDTSDPLMVAFLWEYADHVVARHPAGKGRGRPPRIRSAALCVAELQHAEARANCGLLSKRLTSNL